MITIENDTLAVPLRHGKRKISDRRQKEKPGAGVPGLDCAFTPTVKSKEGLRPQPAVSRQENQTRYGDQSMTNIQPIRGARQENPLTFDLTVARLHVEALTGDADTSVLIVTQDDDKARLVADAAILKAEGEGDGAYHRAKAKFAGPHRQAKATTLTDLVARWIEARQADGCGVFILVHDNGTAGKGRRKKDIGTARAIWCESDDDRAAATPFPLPPSFSVESSSGRHHHYWCPENLGELSLDLADAMNQRIVESHGGDGGAKDRSRVLRLAGSWNLKPGRPPWHVTLHLPGGIDDFPLYRVDQLKAAFPPVVKLVPERPSRSMPQARRFAAEEPLLSHALKHLVDAGQLDGYEDWLGVGMALHRAFEGAPEALDMWIDASRPNAADACAAKWRSFDADRPESVTLGTVYRMAHEAGWRKEDATRDIHARLAANIAQWRSGALARSRQQGEGETETEAAGRSDAEEITGIIDRMVAAETPELEAIALLREIAAERGGFRLRDLEKQYRAALREWRRSKARSMGAIQWADASEDGSPITSSVNNVAVWLDHHGMEPRMDVFTRRVHINGTALAGDAEENRLFARMHADGLRVSRRFVTEAVNSLADLNSFDSLADYFARLEWDGVPRVERFGSVYMGAEDSELGRALDKTWFMGAACRAMYPGSKFDLLPIWQGAQGFGKSTAIRHLCPNPEWFFDGYAIHESAARMMEQTAGKFLCEWSELSGMKTRDIERIKGNVSQVSDTDRLAYGYRATTVARRYVVVGTTNDDKPLRDSANRRFPVRRVLREADTATIRRDRDQLWAEAAHLCREYMREAYADTDRACDREISLPRVWWEAAAKATEEFRDGGVIEDMIEDLVDGVKDGFIRASVLAARLEMKPTQSQDRIIQIMKALGWRKTKLRMPNNARVHVYMIGELEKAQVREIGQLR